VAKPKRHSRFTKLTPALARQIPAQSGIFYDLDVEQSSIVVIAIKRRTSTTY
jgi:hypothetical protein